MSKAAQQALSMMSSSLQQQIPSSPVSPRRSSLRSRSKMRRNNVVSIKILLVEPKSRYFELVRIHYIPATTTLQRLIQLATRTATSDLAHLSYSAVSPANSTVVYRDLTVKASSKRKGDSCLVAIPDGSDNKVTQDFAKEVLKQINESYEKQRRKEQKQRRKPSLDTILEVEEEHEEDNLRKEKLREEEDTVSQGTVETVSESSSFDETEDIVREEEPVINEGLFQFTDSNNNSISPVTGSFLKSRVKDILRGNKPTKQQKAQPSDKTNNVGLKIRMKNAFQKQQPKVTDKQPTKQDETQVSQSKRRKTFPSRRFSAEKFIEIEI